MQTPRLLEKPLAAPNMELIYVNPEGPSGKPVIENAIKHIRSSFALMTMDDEETVTRLFSQTYLFPSKAPCGKSTSCQGLRDAGGGSQWTNPARPTGSRSDRRDLLRRRACHLLLEARRVDR